MTQYMGHEIEPQTEAHRLLQNASMARGEVNDVIAMVKTWPSGFPPTEAAAEAVN